MCAICGLYGCENKFIIKKMCDVLSHRGPDGEGLYIDSNICLGHRRLSIIDLAGGDQPIHNEDETIWVIFNGEIYNFMELRSELEKNGHKFYTNSDTEVLVHLYEECGDKLVYKLNGMFAFAIWDSINKRLVIARDPLGKKPLYYYFNNVLIFASEIKAILEAGVIKEVDVDALYSYLAYQYTVGENTLFKGIKKLLGGHLLTVEKGKLSIKQYWDIEENIYYDSEANLIKKLRCLLEKSAKYRMIADVPIGAFLSGGIDSSSAVALTRPMIDEYHTFSLGFETFSELASSKRVSEYLDTIHHELVLTSDVVFKEIAKIAWYYDEPMGDPAIISNYFLSKLAKKYVKVVIAGEAADELFGGYYNYKIGLAYHRLFLIPHINYFLGRVADPLMSKGLYKYRFEHLLECLTKSNFELAHLNTYRAITDWELRQLTEVSSSNLEKSIIISDKVQNPLNKMLYVDCKNQLPEKFLMKADKATMANSIEERLPFLDKNLVEFAFSLPPNLKIKNGVDKYILRMAVRNLLPQEIVSRKKQGFGTPVYHWIQNDDFKTSIVETLNNNELLIKFINREQTYKIINDFKKSKCSDKNKYNDKLFYNYKDMMIWTLFTLGMWYDTFFR